MGSGTADSDNTNNTSSIDPQYLTDVNQHHCLRYWIPTSSKLSRGKKDIIQRMFVGEPLKNMCNVFVYDQTTESWFHEHTILGDPNRNGPVLYPSLNLTSTGSTVNGIIYNTTASINNPDSYHAFGTSHTMGATGMWTTEDLSGNTNDYPRYQPSGWGGGTWVSGTYVGTASLGGYNGNWVKMQVSTPIQPTVLLSLIHI